MRRRNVSVILTLVLATATMRSANAQDTTTSNADSLRVFISLDARRLHVVNANGDTLRTAPAAVGSGRALASDLRSWQFNTPKGVTTVIRKEENPVWIPPDWHYVEIARHEHLRVAWLTADKPVALRRGRALVVRDGQVGVIDADSVFTALPRDEEIVFGGTLYIPPFGTVNRMIEGELGAYRLNLANGVGIHGTPYKDSVGRAVTHGCVRLNDEDIAWLYENVPVGTRVIIY